MLSQCNLHLTVSTQHGCCSNVAVYTRPVQIYPHVRLDRFLRLQHPRPGAGDLDGDPWTPFLSKSDRVDVLEVLRSNAECATDFMNWRPMPFEVSARRFENVPYLHSVLLTVQHH